MPSGANKNHLRFLMLCIIWGSTWIGTKAGIQAVPPLVFAGTRFTAAGMLLLLYAWANGNIAGLKVRDGIRFTAASMLMITLCYGPLFWGMQYINSGTAAVLEMSLTPIALLVFALLLGEETLDGRRIFAIALGVCGLVVLFWPASAYVSLPEAFPGASLWGGLAVASAAFTYGYGSVLARPLLRSYPALFVSGVTTSFGGFVLLMVALAFEPGAVSALSGDWGMIAWLGWFFLVIFGSLIGYTTFMRLLRDIGASRAGSYAFVSPVIAVALGAAVFAERITVMDVIGIIVMLSGACLAMSGAPATEHAALES
ncbi:drug/metabolite transporter (DMT)-like permease [Rhizobium sp. BK226]|jgi:drug/metabolite transporter (DMT)-like permease|uniref:DMT family transporter n=2 Tax=Rhizobium TaxID=379 RepID=UPI0004017C5D|nr:MULTISPECIES: EamA family transporter [Rhizobium]MBB3298862.1 drug/metabolite transporter (DMT)-like permease [Rhizobium sp. BK112]MBB3367230.1 drug/metabolite transporter (DMT)-like permease [Rhizobium sp. BK077]MBB4111892.1 drug/metabolite transporter (DMT)-like permease [Rhizobium sp. BK226]MBB4178754.1 drug/metabolite transporter (DMT)-like permease [Rhizobium sp. BK109]GGD71210.1 drug/metabolite exporter YedA [Rhizobium anhuiense]